MSREEAHRRIAAGRRRATTGRVTAERTPAGPVPPQPPLFTARTDATAGVLRARGHLDLVGAEVLCRIVTACRQLGHREVLVQLGSATVADDAHELLADLARRMATDGDRLVLR